ncbi:deoxyguanosinetriphosphate triphosphohydrolase [Sporomusaceae bacterium FL31]|nr:deoxyguanosinetriphosphate triphosphohydrolase [Sporomusaceae bacterium FL31]GCE34341.1 deoxyguanosinetriphosphate triphosphohydrolase [Sporomusaceae bacterium]
MSNFFEFEEWQVEVLVKQREMRNKGLSDFATKDSDYITKYSRKASEDYCKSAFTIDVDRILHNIFYNRYADKTQVFSFYKNDDITRRSLHVQLVSRIARTIGQSLNLNLDLIEAIAIGHDMGHTPFGHVGETYLSEKYNANTKRFFNHNVHSVRVLQTITNSNLTLQTLDGILCHNGEKAFSHYQPIPPYDFDEFDKKVEACYTNKDEIAKLTPCTLEGCVVRISDMIAYVGKDRQDAARTRKYSKDRFKHNAALGTSNSEIVKNMIINVVKNSLGQNFLKIDDEVYYDFCKLKEENNRLIYRDPEIDYAYDNKIKPMMSRVYDKLLDDVYSKKYQSPIFKHHINYSILYNYYRHRERGYVQIEPNDIVVDYIASMTDDYFVDLYAFLFPESQLSIEYKTYFEDYNGVM